MMFPWYGGYGSGSGAGNTGAAQKAAEPPANEVKRPKKPPIPFACIRRVANGTESLCGRSIGSEEYAFGDARHAVEFYSKSNFLRCCGECAEQAKTKGLIGAPEGGHVASNYKA